MFFIIFGIKLVHAKVKLNKMKKSKIITINQVIKQPNKTMTQYHQRRREGKFFFW